MSKTVLTFALLWQDRTWDQRDFEIPTEEFEETRARWDNDFLTEAEMTEGWEAWLLNGAARGFKNLVGIQYWGDYQLEEEDEE